MAAFTTRTQGFHFDVTRRVGNLQLFTLTLRNGGKSANRPFPCRQPGVPVVRWGKMAAPTTSAVVLRSFGPNVSFVTELLSL